MQQNTIDLNAAKPWLSPPPKTDADFATAAYIAGRQLTALRDAIEDLISLLASERSSRALIRLRHHLGKLSLKTLDLGVDLELLPALCRMDRRQKAHRARVRRAQRMVASYLSAALLQQKAARSWTKAFPGRSVPDPLRDLFFTPADIDSFRAWVIG